MFGYKEVTLYVNRILGDCEGDIDKTIKEIRGSVPQYYDSIEQFNNRQK